MLDFRYFKLNPLGEIFKKFFIKIEKEEQEAFEENSQGISDEEYAQFMQASKMGGHWINSSDNVIMTTIDFELMYNSKLSRIAKYKEMAKYPEISDALGYVIDEAIVEDDDGNIINLNFKEKIPRAIEKQLLDVWDDTINNVFKVRKNAKNLFKRFMIDGELFLENVLNKKKNDVQTIKILPAFTMFPIYNNSTIDGYKQAIPHSKMPMNHEKNERNFNKNQILYVNSGNYGSNNLDIFGYLENSTRVYNMLKSLEDAMVVYRLVRAPERRVWNVAVGKMPKGKAEAYLRGLIARFKKRHILNPENGKVDSTQNIQSLTEDYWFAQDDMGKQTTVNTIGGSSNFLNNLDDINYFVKKLFKALQIPRSRWDENYVSSSPYSIGRVGEITREEIKFSHFVDGYRNRFKSIFIDCFKLKCKMKNIDEKWYTDKIINVQFTESNLFKEFKQIEIDQARFGMFSNVYSYVKSQMNPDGFIALKFAIQKYLKFSDEELRENEKFLKEQEKEEKEKQQDLQFGNSFDDNEEDNEEDNDNDPVSRFNKISNDEEEGKEGEEEEEQEEEQEIKNTKYKNGIRSGRKVLLNSEKSYYKYAKKVLNEKYN